MKSKRLMINVFSSGLVKASNVALLVNLIFDEEAEYLPGKSTKDECEPLMKQYKLCLNVRLMLPVALFDANSD